MLIQVILTGLLTFQNELLSFCFKKFISISVLSPLVLVNLDMPQIHVFQMWALNHHLMLEDRKQL